MMNGSPDPCSDAHDHTAQTITVVIRAIQAYCSGKKALVTV
ncbi:MULTISPECIES: hypothetical protein [unclassified Bacillus (in: firmicutes)]|nr:MULTISPECIES: hypothetical protein [unclassified Bacillus (in: firmicutes)]